MRTVRTIGRQLIELAGNQVHQAAGSGHGGQFAPKGAAAGGSAAAPKNPKQQQQIKQVAVLQAEAKNCQQQAATINTQIQALAALITQETYSLSTGRSTSNSASTAASTTGTSSAASTAPATTGAAVTAAGAPGATATSPSGSSLQQQLQANIGSVTTLRKQRDALISKANLYTQQATALSQLAA
jgi:hypothetical protein